MEDVREESEQCLEEDIGDIYSNVEDDGVDVTEGLEQFRKGYGSGEEWEGEEGSS
jgi:hypothetical protein